jgi:hypothetical protein
MVFLETLTKPLLIIHALLAIALVGATTHNGLLAIQHLRGNLKKIKLRQTYTEVVFWLFLVTYVFGLLIYPAFRVYVRAHYLDEHVPLATGFFEVKEHWLGVAMGALCFSFAFNRWGDIRSRSPLTILFDGIGVMLMLAIWLSTVTGLVLVSLKGV